MVTAVFNRVDTIGDTLASVRSQSYPFIEHVIQDGGSTDGTLELVRGAVPHWATVESDKDNGLYDALNRGISRATGDIIGLLHSDDFFASEDVIAKVAAAFRDLSIQGVYGDLQYVSASDPMHVVRHWRAGRFTQSKLRRGWMPPHPTLYLRREVFERLGLYDTGFQIAADYDAMLRYLGSGGVKVSYIPEVLVKMRLGGESNGSFRKILRKSNEDLRALRRNGVGGWPTLVAKNLSKLVQFYVKDARPE